MKRTLRLIALSGAFIFAFHPTHAQLKSPFSKGGSIAGDVQKVISDYPNHLHSLSGEVLDKRAQSTDFACTFKPDGAESCIITQYSATHKTVVSWKALMLTTENFDDARKKFKNLYTQLHNKPVAYGGKTYRLKGAYEAPVEEKDFASCILELDAEDGDAANLKVEISLQVELLEWKVSVMIYDRERNDDERGKIIED